MDTSRVLVVAPHPDDDIIGCGGSMVMHLEKDEEVSVVYVTNGDAPCPEHPTSEFTAIRQRETKAAARILGLREENLYFLNESPWGLREEAVRLELLRLVRKLEPNVCYIPHSEDAHADHQMVSRATLDAIRMAPGKWFSTEQHTCPAVGLVLAYEVWTPLQDPTYLEDITSYLEQKMTALMAHRSQNVAKYERACRGLHAYRGAMQGECEYAEAFQILVDRKIWE